MKDNRDGSYRSNAAYNFYIKEYLGSFEVRAVVRFKRIAGGAEFLPGRLDLYSGNLSSLQEGIT